MTLWHCANLPPALIPVEGAPWKRASVRCGGGEVEKKMRHRCGRLTHNSELGFESLLFLYSMNGQCVSVWPPTYLGLAHWALPPQQMPQI